MSRAKNKTILEMDFDEDDEDDEDYIPSEEEEDDHEYYDDDDDDENAEPIKKVKAPTVKRLPTPVKSPPAVKHDKKPIKKPSAKSPKVVTRAQTPVKKPSSKSPPSQKKINQEIG